MKKLITITAALALVVGLAGCGTTGVTASDVPPLDKPAPSSQPSEEATVEPPAPGPEEGSREAPLPYGQEVLVYNLTTNDVLWQITVGDPFDATADIAAANQFNEPPASGTYLAVPVHIVWQGTEAVTPWADFQYGIDLSFVSADGVTTESSYVVQPWAGLMDIADLYQGGAADFTQVFDVAAGTPGLVRVTAGGYDFFVGNR